MKNSSHTGRFPRDLESAFGPYQRSSQCVIEPMPDTREKARRAADIALYVVGVLGVIAAIVFNNFN